MSRDNNDQEKGICPQEKFQWSPVEGISSFVPALEGFRGLAVLMTCVSHFECYSPNFRHHLGNAGVTLFFVLSGFLITGVLKKLQSSNTTRRGQRVGHFSHIPRFYLDRMVRLYPALILMILITGTLHAWKHAWHITPSYRNAAFLALTYTSNMRTWAQNYVDFYSSTWTLAVEEQYYILWSLILPFIMLQRARNRNKIMFALVFASFSIKSVGRIWHWTRPDFMFSYYSNVSNFWKMLVGSSLRIVPVPPWLLQKRAVYLGTFFITISQLVSIVTVQEYLGFRGQICSLILASLHEILEAFSAVLIILGSLGGFPILETSLLRFIGRCSYSLYLYQVPILKLNGGLARGFSGLESTCLSFVLASISTLYAEEPIRDRYQKWKAINISN